LISLAGCGSAQDQRGPFYTVTPDGQKFIIVEDAEGDQVKVPAIQVTQNWFAEFKGRQAAER
jgi:hypothetical protein